MGERGPTIFGLEFQARTLCSQLAEVNDVCFFVASQSMKSANQVSMLQLDEETAALKAKAFLHPLGEVWKLASSPHDKQSIITCYTTVKGSQVVRRAALHTLPDMDDLDSRQEFHPFANSEIIDTENSSSEIKTTEFHPNDSQLLGTVCDDRVLIIDRAESQVRTITEVDSKSSLHFTGGKWAQHHQGNQFIVLCDCSIKSFDIRDPKHCAWTIEDAHDQLVRDLDCNPNKQCHIVTGGDDGAMKIWDCRNTREAIFTRSDHSHWIWSVRFNTFHDQLILSSSSDCKVLLTCAGSVSSETLTGADDSNLSTVSNRERLADGLLQTFDQHEDSVYAAEWSSADPWIFASLSYDGRVIVFRVPKTIKYQIV